MLVFSVFNVLMCFKIVFGLNTYSATIDLDQTEHYLSAGGYEFRNLSQKRDIVDTRE